jgi:hypothetical protein
MARKHECPDCGAAHELSAEGRIVRLEKRVKELETDRDAHRCGHGCTHYWWTTYPWIVTTGSGTGDVWQPDNSTTITYDSSNAPQITLTS